MNYLDYWFLFPMTLLVSTVATAVGIEVLACLAPLLWAGLDLTTDAAIAVGLCTTVCTCGSALSAYLPTGLVDYKVGLRFLAALVPTTMIGVVLGISSNNTVQVSVMGVSLLVVGVSFLRSPQKLDIVLMNQTIEQVYGGKHAETLLQSASGEQFSYTSTNWIDGMGISAIAGLLFGFVGNGLGELNSYFWVQRCRIPSQVAIATSIFVLTILSTLATLGYGIALTLHHPDTLTPVVKAILFMIPGGLLGGQLGSIMADRMPLPPLERMTAGFLSGLGGWVLSHVLWS